MKPLGKVGDNRSTSLAVEEARFAVTEHGTKA
jgi:hypothetical protein